MSLSDLASIGSFISGFAVLVSLIFLYFQLRQVNAQVAQTERNQRALMNQGIVNRISENIRWQTEPHMTDVLTRVGAGETEFTAREIYELQLRLRSQLVSAQDNYVQHQAGLADQITLDNTMGATRVLLAQPIFRALWKSGRRSYAPEWMAYIDKLIEQTPVAKPVDVVARLKTDLAEVLR